MNSRIKIFPSFYAIIATLLFVPLGLLAQEEEEPATTQAVQAKLAIELGAPFCDNMILQREMDVPVWGWSKSGTTITVEFAGQKQATETGKDGKWMLKLKPLKASAEPAELTISDSSGKKVVLKNVLVGEVWMASGQSNMQWRPAKCDVSKLLKQIADNVKAGKEKQPVIREFEVTSVYCALHPIEHATGAWKNGDTENYSAIATAFAYELYKELGVPVGILNCSFSMTSIRAWTPRCGFRDGKDAGTREISRTLAESDPSTPEHKAAWDQYYADTESALKEGKAVSTKTPGNLAGNRDATWMYNGRMNPVVPYALRGAIWNQCYSSMFEGVDYYHRLHSLIRGWREVWAKPDLPVYFHQLYAPGANDGLTLNDMGEMRLGFWLARDIPNVGMASQIDITGGIHYYDKALPGKRLALHALKNQYGKKIVADGPMFKSYAVKGDTLIVSFDFAEGGLLTGKAIAGKTLDGPVAITNDAEPVTLFYLADKDRVWHRAKMKIAGETVELSAPGVTTPRGVAYACNGIGGLPNLYNRAMLPLSPFIYYDNKLVTSKDWPDAPIKVAGVVIDPSTVGKQNDYRKMPLVSAQFRDNAVFQADMPVTFWGSAVNGDGEEAKGKAEIKFSFAGIEKTIPVTPGMKEWQVTVPPMPASAEPKSLKVTFMIDGEFVHERTATNIVFGDVWYVAAPVGAGTGKDGNGAVRVMTRKAQGFTSDRPRRFSVCSSTGKSGNRFDSVWRNADGGLPGLLGERIHAKTGKPVGIIYMEGDAPALKQWIAADDLRLAPSLRDDFNQLEALKPGNPLYAANGRAYIAAWRKYWSDYIPQIIAGKHVPDGAVWGSYPGLSASATTEASQAFNVLVHSFWPGSFKGILFVSGESLFKDDQGANFGEQFTLLANSWKTKFACPDPVFVYTIPSSTLAPKITRPKAIQGRSVAMEINSWLSPKATGKPDPKAGGKSDWTALIEKVMGEVYK
jgi:sialate O-acetylesterase